MPTIRVGDHVYQKLVDIQHERKATDHPDWSYDSIINEALEETYD